jgi:lipopolysaccharide transport system permease protein
MPSDRPEVTYSARAGTGLSWRVWREMAHELVDSRELTWRLFLRDFSARYRQSLLGYTWAFVSTVVTVGTFTWLNRARVLPVADDLRIPYPVFLMVNLTVWQAFASGLTSATQSLVNAGSLITKINFPRESLVIAAVGQGVFEFAVRLVLLVIAFFAFKTVPHAAALALPLLVLPLFLWTLGLGFMSSLVNGVMRDAGHIVLFLLNFWMFLTPVVYPAPKDSLITAWNPITPFVVAAQDLVTTGRLSNPGAYAASSAVGLLVFLVGWRLFHVTGPRIAERV